MQVHLMSPGVASAKVSGGGTPLFRGVAALLANHCEVVAYEPAGAEAFWNMQGVVSSPWEVPEDAIKDLREKIRNGDLVVKVSGALPGRWDMAADYAVATLASRDPAVRAVYLDVDAPSRLPVLQYGTSYLDKVLPSFDKIILLGGGARAFHAYQAMTDTSVLALTTALAWYGVRPPGTSALGFDTDVIAVFGGDPGRRTRIQHMVEAMAGAGLTVGLVGLPLEESPRGVTGLGYLDGAALATAIARSRFSISLLRDDVLGYADIHPCRIVEAARLGSIVVSEPFPGLARLVAAGVHMVPLDADHTKTARVLADMSDSTHRRMAQRAMRRVGGVARAEGRSFVRAALGDLT